MGYEVFVDAAWLRKAVAKRWANAHSSQIRFDPRHMHAAFRDLECPPLTGETLPRFGVRFYDGDLPDSHPNRPAQRDSFRVLRQKVKVLTTPLKPDRVRIKGPTKTAVETFAAKHGLDPEAVVDQLDDLLARSHSQNPMFLQKGVDTMLAVDLVLRAAHDCYAVAIVVSGDRDFIPAIRAVREMGKQVVLAVPDHSRPGERHAAVSPFVESAVDHVQSLDKSFVGRILRRRD